MEGSEAVRALRALVPARGPSSQTDELVTLLHAHDRSVELLVGHLTQTPRARFVDCRRRLGADLAHGWSPQRGVAAVVELSLEALDQAGPEARTVVGILACFATGCRLPAAVVGPLRDAVAATVAIAADRVDVALDLLRARRLLDHDGAAWVLPADVAEAVTPDRTVWTTARSVLTAATRDEEITPSGGPALLPLHLRLIGGVPEHLPFVFFRAGAVALSYAEHVAAVDAGAVDEVVAALRERAGLFPPVRDKLADLLDGQPARGEPPATPAPRTPSDDRRPVVAPDRWLAALVPPPRTSSPRPPVVLVEAAAPGSPGGAADAEFLLARAASRRDAGRFDEAEADLAPILAVEPVPGGAPADTVHRRAQVEQITISRLRGDLAGARSRGWRLLHDALDVVTRWRLRFDLAQIDQDLGGREPRALRVLRAVLLEGRDLLGPDDPRVLDGQRRYGVAVAEAGHILAGHAQLRVVASAATRLGQERLRLQAAVDAVAAAPAAPRGPDPAAAELAALRAAAAPVLGTEHPVVLQARECRARRILPDDPADAAAELRAVLEIRRQHTGRPARATAATSADLGRALLASGAVDEAREALEAAGRDLSGLLGDRHPQVQETWRHLRRCSGV